MIRSRSEVENLGIAENVIASKSPSQRQAGILSYKAILFLADFGWLTLAFSLCTPIISNDSALIFNISIACTFLFFIFNFRLYSYHLIFSLKSHHAGLARAFIFSLATMAIIVLILASPEQLINLLLVPTAIFFAIAIMAINRKYNKDLTTILYPIGFAFIIIGAFEIFRNRLLVPDDFSWLPAFKAMLLAYFLIAASRSVLVHCVYNRILKRKFRRQLLIVGANEVANHFARHIISLNAPFWIVGTLSYDGCVNKSFSHVSNKDCLGNLEKLPELAQQHNIRELVVTTDQISKQELIRILDFCTSMGINAWFSPSLMPIIDVKLRIDSFCGQPMIRLCSQKRSWLYYKIKYLSDSLITLPVFMLQLPIFFLLMLAIKLNSKGPVFYQTKAIGKNGRPFDMLKFRSMYVNSDKSIHQQYVTRFIKGEINEEEQTTGPIKIFDDPRVTKVGKILRKFSLDELPQLINVLLGQMSLVGPRPCLPYEYELYQDWHKKRTAVRPGITGLWQVTGRSEVLFEDMILLDLYYIYNSSILLDLQILFETIFVVIAKKGAY